MILNLMMTQMVKFYFITRTKWSLHYGCHLSLSQVNAESECSSLSVFWPHSNTTAKFIDDILRNDKTKPNSLSIHSFGVLELTKQLEKLDPISVLYSDTRVLHQNDKFIRVLIWIVNIINSVQLIKLYCLTVGWIFWWVLTWWV